MSLCPWEKIDDFRSLGEFEKFESWMISQIDDSHAEKVDVLRPYLSANTFEEKWFKHKATGEIWRLVWPDFPFTGLFERVSD